MEKGREVQALDLLKQAFPDASMIFCIDNYDEQLTASTGKVPSLAALSVSLVLQVIEKMNPEDPWDAYWFYVSQLLKEGRERWQHSQNASES